MVRVGKLLTFVGACLAPVATLHAQADAPTGGDAAAESGDGGEPLVIVVTGRGLEEAPASPAYGTVRLDRDELIATGSGRLEDTLASIAGFQQFRRSDSRSANPSAQGATLRALGGNATSRALVLLDGIPMSDPFFGYIPFSAIVPELLGGAQVTRGGGSGPFGAGALAGTIELFSADAGTLGPVAARALIGSRDALEASATLAPRLGNGFVVASARYDSGAGFFTTPPEQRVPASVPAGYESWSAQLRGVAPLTRSTELQARVLAFRDQRTLRFAGADSLSEGQDASIRLVGQGRWQFDLLGYVQARNFANVVISSTRFTPVLDQRATPSTGVGGKLEVRPPVGTRTVLRLGADYRMAQGEVAEDAINAFSGAVTERRSGGGRDGDLGLFAEGDRTFGELVVTAGVRVDRFTIKDGFFEVRDAAGAVRSREAFRDRSGWETSLRAGALYSLAGGWRLRAAAYSGLRLPTLNELYRPFVVFPLTTLANADLRNERLVGYEAGAEYRRGRHAVSFTVFDNEVEDAVANVTLATNLRQRRNIDAIRTRGVEVQAEAGWRDWEAEASLAYTDARVRATGLAASLDGKRPAQSPRWAASASLRYRFSGDGSLTATLRHAGAQFEDDLETDFLPAATTLNAYAEVPITGRFGLLLRGENLTGETVITRNQEGSIDLGAPRTVWLGVLFRTR
uniref:TonB-dependent receptor n=1 Tax=Porphyrobacter sp. GA68 TaxID=2883480 RepID=UPI001D17D85B|nr:TonB-dependent receptor [Porphyrobacter sp. GA68]